MLRTVFCAAVATVVAAPIASGQPKAKVQRACGVGAIPLTVGNQWTYQATPTPPDKKLSDAAALMTPKQPKHYCRQRR